MSEEFRNQVESAAETSVLEAPLVRLRLDLSYVGREFHGWQIQPELRTVQGELRHDLTRLMGRPLTPVAAGRTDAGVHARGQVAHLSVRTPEEADRVARVLPRMAAEDILVRGVREVSPSFHARFSATGRRYSYHIQLERDIFRPHAWYVYQKLDRAAMDRAAAQMLGDHDFSSFCKASSLKEDTNHCQVTVCELEWKPRSVIFHVRANRFLHHMVRNMVGMIVEIGVAERNPDDVPRVLNARSRSAAGKMAPAHGLFLEEVQYPEELMNPSFQVKGDSQ